MKLCEDLVYFVFFFEYNSRTIELIKDHTAQFAFKIQYLAKDKPELHTYTYIYIDSLRDFICLIFFSLPLTMKTTYYKFCSNVIAIAILAKKKK